MSKEKSKQRRIDSRLVRVLMVRVMGGFFLFAFYEAVVQVMNGGNIPLVDFGVGMIGLVLLFLGIFMAFGKIEPGDDGKGKPTEFQNGYTVGFDEGYEKAMNDFAEDAANQDPPTAVIPDRAPDEVGV